jgi:hypothetical protein
MPRQESHSYASWLKGLEVDPFPPTFHRPSTSRRLSGGKNKLDESNHKIRLPKLLVQGFDVISLAHSQTAPTFITRLP